MNIIFCGELGRTPDDPIEVCITALLCLVQKCLRPLKDGINQLSGISFGLTWLHIAGNVLRSPAVVYVQHVRRRCSEKIRIEGRFTSRPMDVIVVRVDQRLDVICPVQYVPRHVVASPGGQRSVRLLSLSFGLRW